MSYKFPKSEKLKSRKFIEAIFSDGISLKRYPVKLVFSRRPRIDEDEATVQATFVVPKRLFKSAVKRNRIKRQMREAYRLNKHRIKADFEDVVGMVFIYYTQEKIEYAKIEKSIIYILDKFSETEGT